MRHWRNNRETKRRLKTGADFQTAFYMAGNRQMKYWKVLLSAAVVLVLVGAVIVQADKQQVLRRAVFLDGQLQAYYAEHRVYPQPYEWLAEAERNEGKESYCRFFSRGIEGWGDCYADDGSGNGAWKPAVWGLMYRAVFDRVRGRFEVRPIGSGFD